MPAEREPDFVFVGCNQCGTEQDASRPVRRYRAWLEEPMRHIAYECRTCSLQANHRVQVFPTLLGLWLEDAAVWREGQVAPEPEGVTRIG